MSFRMIRITVINQLAYCRQCRKQPAQQALGSSRRKRERVRARATTSKCLLRRLCRKCKDIKNMIPKPINLQSVGDDKSYSRTNTAKHMINKLESGIAGSREQQKSVLQLAIRVSCSQHVLLAQEHLNQPRNIF